MNERLRGAMLTASITVDDLAATTDVDPKTVQRWITQGRIPRRRTRLIVCDALGSTEAYLWPELEQAVEAVSSAELMRVYPSRSIVPSDLWRRLLHEATERIDILVYAAAFLVEAHDLLGVLKSKAGSGLRARLLIGDPKSTAVIARGKEEETASGIIGRVELMARYLKDTRSLPGVEVRQHGTVLYTSIYRFDDQLLANGHVYGSPAAASPTILIRRIPGGRMFDHYMSSFEMVWHETLS